MKKRTKKPQDSSLPVWIQRLEEVRKRLITMAASVVAAAILCFVFIDQIRNFLLRPALEMDLDLEFIFITPSEALMANIRLAIICGIIVVLPILLYQVITLILPFLEREKKRTLVFLITGMFFLFGLGLVFAYEFVYPIALNFFVSFADDTLEPLFTISHYLSFFTSFLLAFGLVFQLPLVFWFLGVLGLVDPPFLRRNRKFALLIMFALSAVVTPPDVFSQALMVVPLVLLYELGILLVVLTCRKRRKAEAKEI